MQAEFSNIVIPSLLSGQALSETKDLKYRKQTMQAEFSNIVILSETKDLKLRKVIFVKIVDGSVAYLLINAIGSGIGEIGKEATPLPTSVK